MTAPDNNLSESIRLQNAARYGVKTAIEAEFLAKTDAEKRITVALKDERLKQMLTDAQIRAAVLAYLAQGTEQVVAESSRRNAEYKAPQLPNIRSIVSSKTDEIALKILFEQYEKYLEKVFVHHKYLETDDMLKKLEAEFPETVVHKEPTQADLWDVIRSMMLQKTEIEPKSNKVFASVQTPEDNVQSFEMTPVPRPQPRDSQTTFDEKQIEQLAVCLAQKRLKDERRIAQERQKQAQEIYTSYQSYTGALIAEQDKLMQFHQLFMKASGPGYAQRAQVESMQERVYAKIGMVQARENKLQNIFARAFEMYEESHQAMQSFSVNPKENQYVAMYAKSIKENSQPTFDFYKKSITPTPSVASLLFGGNKKNNLDKFVDDSSYKSPSPFNTQLTASKRR